jgi:hypothetical protein
MHRQGYDLQMTQYDERGWRATFYTTGMEHSPASATGTGGERTPWHATQRAACEALKKVSRDGLDGESFEIPDLTTSDVHPNGPPARVQRDAFAAGRPRDRGSGRDRGREITHGDQQEGVKTKDLAIARSRRSAGRSPHCSASEGGEQGGERDAERTAVRQDRFTGDPGSHSGARATRPSQARFPMRHSRGTRRPRPK